MDEENLEQENQDQDQDQDQEDDIDNTRGGYFHMCGELKTEEIPPDLL